LPIVSVASGPSSIVPTFSALNTGVEVMAPTDTLWILPDGRMTIGPQPPCEHRIVAAPPPWSETVTLRKVGYFRELPHGDPQRAALRESVGAASLENESAIVTHLTNGNVLATSPMLVHDALDAGGLRHQVVVGAAVAS
jgi:hypothetical protein